MTEFSSALLLKLAQHSNFSYNDNFVQNEFNQFNLPYQHISTSTPRYFDVPVYNYDSGTTDYVTTTDGYTGHAFLNTQTNTLVIACQGSQRNWTD